MASPKDGTFPLVLRSARVRAGLTVAALARQVCFSRSHLNNVELGHRGCPAELVPILDRALAAEGELVRAWEVDEEMRRREFLVAGAAAAVHALPLSATDPVEEAVGIAAELRRSLLVRPLAHAAAPRDLGRIAREVRAAHALYHRAEYESVCRMLPALIGTAEAAVIESSGSVRAHRLLAVAYLAASKIAAKIGDRELDWIAADRAASSAQISGDELLLAVIRLQIASALFNLPRRRDDAAAVVETAHTELSRSVKAGDSVSLSAQGAIWLFRAGLASRSGRSAEARRCLEEASGLARLLGTDRNDLWTAFGPTNVATHRLAVLNALGRPDEAIAAASRINTGSMPAELIGRRAQVHLDLAAAFTRSGQSDPAAVLHLLEAERLAPQVVRVNHRPRAMITELVGRERRVATPGLRSLAERSGAWC